MSLCTIGGKGEDEEEGGCEVRSVYLQPSSVLALLCARVTFSRMPVSACFCCGVRALMSCLTARSTSSRTESVSGWRSKQVSE